VTAALRDRSTVTLVSVAPDVTSEALRWPGTAVDIRGLQEEADAEAERTLREAVERIPGELPVQTVLRRGKAGPEIVELANCGKFDAVLMGARGVGRVATLVGSVSSYVLHHARIVVFVAHDPAGAAQ
jgi:nucleotide-binding universal stress UspA family protein